MFRRDVLLLWWRLDLHLSLHRLKRLMTLIIIWHTTWVLHWSLSGCLLIRCRRMAHPVRLTHMTCRRPRGVRYGLTMAHLIILLALQIHLMMWLRILVMMRHSLMHISAVTLARGWAGITRPLRISVRSVSLGYLISGLMGLLHHRMLAGRKLLLLFLLMRVSRHCLLSILIHLRISMHSRISRGRSCRVLTPTRLHCARVAHGPYLHVRHGVHTVGCRLVRVLAGGWSACGGSRHLPSVAVAAAGGSHRRSPVTASAVPLCIQILLSIWIHVGECAAACAECRQFLKRVLLRVNWLRVS